MSLRVPRGLAWVLLWGAVAAAGGLTALDALARSRPPVVLVAVWPERLPVSGPTPSFASLRQAGAEALAVPERTLAGLVAEDALAWSWGWRLRAEGGAEADSRSLRPDALYLRAHDPALQAWLHDALVRRWPLPVRAVELGDEPWLEVSVPPVGLRDDPPAALWRLPLGVWPGDLARAAGAGLLPLPALEARASASDEATLAALPAGTPVLLRGPAPGAEEARRLGQVLRRRGLRPAVEPGWPAAAVQGLRAGLGAWPLPAWTVSPGAPPPPRLRLHGGVVLLRAAEPGAVRAAARTLAVVGVAPGLPEPAPAAALPPPLRAVAGAAATTTLAWWLGSPSGGASWGVRIVTAVLLLAGAALGWLGPAIAAAGGDGVGWAAAGLVAVAGGALAAVLAVSGSPDGLSRLTAPGQAHDSGARPGGGRDAAAGTPPAPPAGAGGASTAGSAARAWGQALRRVGPWLRATAPAAGIALAAACLARAWAGERWAPAADWPAGWAALPALAALWAGGTAACGRPAVPAWGLLAAPLLLWAGARVPPVDPLAGGLAVPLGVAATAGAVLAAACGPWPRRARVALAAAGAAAAAALAVAATDPGAPLVLLAGAHAGGWLLGTLVGFMAARRVSAGGTRAGHPAGEAAAAPGRGVQAVGLPAVGGAPGVPGAAP